MNFLEKTESIDTGSSVLQCHSEYCGEDYLLKENFDDMVNIFISAGLTEYVLYLLDQTNYLTPENTEIFINHAMEDQPELAETLIEIKQRLFGYSSLDDIFDI